MDRLKSLNRFELIYSGLFVVAVLTLTTPLILVKYFYISQPWFIVLNLIGFLIATVRIVLAIVSSYIVKITGSESTMFKKASDREAKLLFVLVVFIQFLNITFVHFD